jgi:GDP-L-fucose synthase
MNKTSKIYIAGHRGLVGSAILNNLKSKGYKNLIVRTHKELDLTNQKAVFDFFAAEKPEYVFLAAAKVGGIVANNTYRADFIYENLMIQNNLIHQAYIHKVKKLLFLGSTCIYPKNCPQPMKEEYLLTDILEYTNEPYAIAKIAGIKMCESYNLQYGTNFIAAQPTNLYGPNDNFDLEKSHVLPALIRKIYLGKALEKNNWDAIKKDLNKLPIEGITGENSEDEIIEILSTYGVRHFDPEYRGEATSNSKSQVQVEIWGSGKPMREFLWSEDMAEACVYLMENIDFKDIVTLSTSLPAESRGEGSQNVISNEAERSQLIDNETRNTHINIGTGKDISIKDLANTIKHIIGFNGDLFFNTNKPDGTMKKLTDISKINKLGWSYTINLEEGIKKVYQTYTNNN